MAVFLLEVEGEFFFSFLSLNRSSSASRFGLSPDALFFPFNFVASSRLPGEVVDTFRATSIPDLTNQSLNLPKRNLLKKKKSHPRRMKLFKINS